MVTELYWNYLKRGDIEVNSFLTKTHIISGSGSLCELPEILKRKNKVRPIIVTDSGIEKSGQLNNLLDILKEYKNLEVFTEVCSDPTATLMDTLAKQIKENKCDVAIAYGGGSSIDTAKGASIVVTNGGSARDYIGEKNFAKTPLTIMAIPTTAGTGSEVSWHASIVDDIENLKVRIRNPNIIPDVAILDSELLCTLPENVAAACGIDAFTHAYES